MMHPVEGTRVTRARQMQSALITGLHLRPGCLPMCVFFPDRLKEEDFIKGLVAL